MVQIPESVKLILRENAQELKDALRQGKLSPNESLEAQDLPKSNSSLLEWAVGWAEGVEILLEFGADASRYFRPLLYRGEGYHRSAILLLRAGCLFSKGQLNESVLSDRDRMQRLVIELATRRKKLRKLAEAHLSSAMIPSSTKTSLLDGPDSLKVYNLLAACKVNVPQLPSQDFFWGVGETFGETVYHGLYTKKCAEALWEIGFCDTDMVDLKGSSPLGSLAVYFSFPRFQVPTEIVRWHISKRADLHRQFPWINESIAHVLIVNFTYNLLVLHASDKSSHSYHMSKIEKAFQELLAIDTAFILPPTVSDRYPCACSPGGCTGVSAILRELTSITWYRRFADYGCSDCYRDIFNLLHEWHKDFRQDPRTFITSLTFNALGLTHTCFGSVKKGTVQWNAPWPDEVDYIHEHCDQNPVLDEFNELLAELDQKFDELRLPLKEFLAGYWYRRVKDHLLTPQPLQEQHIASARSLGVELEFHGVFVPDWIETLFAAQVEEVSDDYSASDTYHV